MSKQDILSQLQKDADGNLILNPVTEWITSTLAETAVLVAFRYASKPEELETGGKLVQFVPTPQQCRELAARLTTLADIVLAPDPDASVS